MTQWLMRYISVYLWLPVADLFSAIMAKIQVLILQNDIDRLATDPTFSIDASGGVYIVFMMIGIIGYFTVPTVAGWVIQAGGTGNYGRNVNTAATKGGSFAAGAAGAAAGNITGKLMKN
jgi:conjugative transposon TraJ protein